METTGLAAKIVLFLSGLNGVTAYLVVFGILLACGLGLPVPEDITLISAGILAGLDKISLPGALLVGFFGVMLGDSFLFFLGRKLGRRVFDLPFFRKFFTEKRIQKAEARVLRNSKFICFTGRFLPGLRAPIFLTSGILGVPPSTFLLLDGLAALLSVPIWVVGGWWFAHNLDHALALAKEMQLFLLAAIVIAGLGYYFLRRKGKAANETNN